VVTWKKDMFIPTGIKKNKEIREKMGRGIIGAERFRKEIGRKMIEIKRPRRGRPRK